MNSASILIIEDEQKISRLLELELTHEGYLTTTENDGKAGLETALDNSFDLILLDIMLPKLNVIEVCRQIRRVSQIPIIMITAKDYISDKVTGLDMGADDYITKPFLIEELLARVRSILRRINFSAQNQTQTLTVGDLVLDESTHLVTRNNTLIDLTKREYQLLAYLMKNEGIVLSRESLMENVWDLHYYENENIVDVYIRYLRNKIDQPFKISLIHTIRGFGYVLRVDHV